MNNLNFIYLVEVERRKDQIAKAENQRMIRNIQPENNRTRHIMMKLGSTLVSAGNWLQKRYADLPVAYPAHPLVKSQTGEC